MMRRVGIRGERGDGKVVKGKGEEGRFREGAVNGYYLTEVVSKAESRGRETTGGSQLWCGCGRGGSASGGSVVGSCACERSSAVVRFRGIGDKMARADTVLGVGCLRNFHKLSRRLPEAGPPWARGREAVRG